MRIASTPCHRSDHSHGAVTPQNTHSSNVTPLPPHNSDSNKLGSDKTKVSVIPLPGHTAQGLLPAEPKVTITLLSTPTHPKPASSPSHGGDNKHGHHHRGGGERGIKVKDSVKGSTQSHTAASSSLTAPTKLNLASTPCHRGNSRQRSQHLRGMVSGIKNTVSDLATPPTQLADTHQQSPFTMCNIICCQPHLY